MDRATNGAARILVASPFLVTIFSDARDRAQIKLQSTHPKFNQLFGNAHKSKTKRVDCRHMTLTLKRTLSATCALPLFWARTRRRLIRFRVNLETLVDDVMVETRGARRQSMGLPRKAPTYAKTGGKKELTTKDGHWSGAKKGGARGDSFLASAASTLFVMAIIFTTPFIAVIVYVRSIAARFTERGVRVNEDRTTKSALCRTDARDRSRGDARTRLRAPRRTERLPSRVNAYLTVTHARTRTRVPTVSRFPFLRALTGGTRS